MVREIKARFTQGRIEPLEDVEFKEGDELTISIRERDRRAAKEALARAAGAWKGTIDFEAYLRDLRAARRESGRGIGL
ncbi:MAG: antitoxin family protein [Dehalococcoidia bacterium]